MRKKRFVMNAARREALTGYLMTAPALILIFAVALFPVLRTFYLSTFDLRLNNASLSKTSPFQLGNNLTLLLLL